MKKTIYFILTISLLNPLKTCYDKCPESEDNIVDNYQYGKQFNYERKKRGIPIIPEYWTTKNGIVWYYKEFSGAANERANCGRHLYKSIRIKNDTIVEEKDFYVGFKVGYFSEPNEHIWCLYENLSITYCYNDEKENIYPWLIRGDIVNRSEFPNSLWKADSILRSWGIARMNYMPIDSMQLFKKYEKYEFSYTDHSIDLNN